MNSTCFAAQRQAVKRALLSYAPAAGTGIVRGPVFRTLSSISLRERPALFERKKFLSFLFLGNRATLDGMLSTAYV
jgi:hypothetical protein